MKPVILACFLLSSLLSPAQEPVPPTQTEAHTASAQLESRALAGPRLLDRIPDGTPPPPAKPKPPFLLPPAAAREPTVYQEGGRSISISRIDPIALPPPPVPDAPLTEEQLAAWQAAKDAYAARIKHETFLFLGATVYLPENLPPRSYVTVWGNGRKPVAFWSSADFRLLAGLGRFARDDGSTCRIMMTWSPVRPELVRNRTLSSRVPWKMPEIPAFPDDSDHSARFLPKDPLAFQELDKNISGAIEDLHVLYNREHPRLLAAWQGRERARLAREEELKANPPKPKDIVIRHFDLGESRPVAPAPQPAAPGALPPVRQRRSRTSRTGRRKGPPSSGDRSFLLSCLLAISSLAVIPAATSMIDANNNQVSDIYERAWNNGELLPPGHAPESDADGDGWSLAQEAAAGTDPLTGGAAPNYLQVFVDHVPPVYGDTDEDGIDEVISPETQLLGWSTVSGKAYQLEVSPSMAGGSWMPLGAPRVSTGADMGTGVPITQPDGSTPDRMFFRVAVTDIDEDGDGLESAEEALLGTDPLKRDSDADGVTDREEVVDNQTNPASAADLDQDGIPDDLEKQLAKQFLALHPETGYWGVWEAGLLAGNLDSTHDYTGDGTSIGGMLPIMVSAAKTATLEPSYQVESQMRSNRMAAYSWEWEGSPTGSGSYYYSRPGDYDGIEDISNPQEMTSATLVNRIGSLAFGPATSPEVVEWKPEHAFYRSTSAAAFVSGYFSEGVTSHLGYIYDQKFRIISRTPDHPPLHYNFIKVKSKNTYGNYGLGEVISAEPYSIDLPAGRIATDWTHLEPEMIDGQATVTQLVHTTIEPDANMIGILGDIIKPLNPLSTTKHFVTSKKNPDLPQDFIILTAVGFTADQITPGHKNQIAIWDGGEEDDTHNPLKRKIARDKFGKFTVSIKSKIDGSLYSQMHVWVVWCDTTIEPATASFSTFADKSTYTVSPDPGWKFTFKIQPESILDQSTIDRPILSGLKSFGPPGSDKAYSFKPIHGAGDTATNKWDVSRQYKATIRNPGSIPKNDLKSEGVPLAWLNNQPAAVDTPIQFPLLDSEGNDDPLIPGLPDENTNPYIAYNSSPRLSHQIGELTSYDAPSIRAMNVWGVDGRSYSVELNFKEFARVELWDGTRKNGKFWYRISDNIVWHHYLDTTYNGATGKWINSNSSSGLGHPKP